MSEIMTVLQKIKQHIIGTCLMPPFFGLLAGMTTVALLPFYLLLILAVMMVMFRILTKRADHD